MTAEDMTRARTRSARRTDGTKVLVALDGFCDPDKPCIPGELLRTWHWCRQRGCTCGAHFAGTASSGTAAVGRVTVLAASRTVLIETLGSVIDPDERGPVAARAAAARLLDAVGRWEVGTLVRRKDDVLIPFPPDARITGPHTITFRAAEETE